MENYNDKIIILMRKIGINPAHRGYDYIKEAVSMVLANSNAIYGLTKYMYHDIAKMYNTTPSKVERCIRHTIDHPIIEMGNNDKIAIFGSQANNPNFHITNKAFIFTMVRVIRDEPNNPIWS